MRLVLLAGGFLVLSLVMYRLRFLYFLNLWYAVDCFFNALAGGDPRETMSSRFGKAVRRGNPLARFICKLLHRMDPEHCEDAIAEQLGDRGVPIGATIVGLIWLATFALVFLS